MNLINKLTKKKIKIKKNIFKIINNIKNKINCNVQINVILNIGYNLKIKNQKIEIIEYINKEKIILQLNKKNRKITTKLNNINNINNNHINYIKTIIDFATKDKFNNLIKKEDFATKYKKNLGLIFKDDISIENILQIVNNIETNSINYNKKYIFSEGVNFNNTITSILIANNFNYIKHYDYRNYVLINNLIAKNKKSMESNSKYILKHKLSDLLNKHHVLGRKTAIETLLKLNAKNIDTQKSKVIFNKEIAVKIFLYLAQSIQGNNIYYKTSFMVDKLNKKIFPEWINILEDPFVYKNIGSKPFDNEGINTKKYFIIKNGILKTWITDTYFSRKLNYLNTSNNGGIHNWIFLNNKQNINFQELIQEMNNGIIINELLGEGVNISTGFFSKGATGYIVKNGKIKSSINEFTISGNLINLFKNIINMSNNFNHNSNIKSGSILVSDIQISGK